MYADIHHLSKSGAMVVYPEIKKIVHKKELNELLKKL